jgi:hypothetical protein
MKRSGLILAVMASLLAVWLLPLAGQQAAKAPAWKDHIDFFENIVEVEGIGVPPVKYDPNTSAAYALAREAATVVADRNVAKLLEGVYVDSTTRVVDMGAETISRITEELKRTKIPGGQVVEETSQEEYMRTKLVRVRVRYPLADGVMPLLMNVVKDDIRKKEGALPVFKPATPPPPALPAYDGLIVKVPASFRPSIDPKIFTPKGEIIYGAKTVAMDVLISRGVAQFSNNEGKAKAALENFGCQQVLTVTGSLRTASDAEVPAEEASRILQANEKTSFLEKARVVFLVGKAKG